MAMTTQGVGPGSPSPRKRQDIDEPGDVSHSSGGLGLAEVKLSNSDASNNDLFGKNHCVLRCDKKQFVKSSREGWRFVSSQNGTVITATDAAGKRRPEVTAKSHEVVVTFNGTK